MYCKECEILLRRGLSPDPTCPDCQRLKRSGVATKYRQIPLRIVQDELAAIALSDQIGDSRAGEREHAPPSAVDARLDREMHARRTAFFADTDEDPSVTPIKRETPDAFPKTKDRLRGHLVCFGCHRLILPERAEETEGKSFCADCFERLPVCRACGERVLSGAPVEGVFCPSCRKNAVCCEKCGTVMLESELYRCDGHAFCADCYDELDECEHCGNKVFLYDDSVLRLLCSECLITHIVCEVCQRIERREQCGFVDGHPVCSDCRSELDDCEDCGAPVFALPGEPHPPICASCMRNYVPCDLCHDAIPKRDADRYQVDGQRLCENCFDDLPECEECDTHFFPDSSEERGDTVCRACRDHYTHCDRCGRRIAFTDAYEKDGMLLCHPCYSKKE